MVSLLLQDREAELKGALYGLKLKLKNEAKWPINKNEQINTNEPDIHNLAASLEIPARLSIYKHHALQESQTSTSEELINALRNIIQKAYAEILTILNDENFKYMRVLSFIKALRCACILSEAWRQAHVLGVEDENEEYGTPMTLRELAFWLETLPEKIDPRVFVMIDRNEGDEDDDENNKSNDEVVDQPTDEELIKMPSW